MTGFCFGGAVTWRVAAGVPDLPGACLFTAFQCRNRTCRESCGGARDLRGLDDRINQNIRRSKRRWASTARPSAKIVYPNVDHAFHNDTGARYNAAAASLVGETLAWFGNTWRRESRCPT